MNNLISFISDLSPLSFMGHYILFTIVIFMSVSIFIRNARQNVNKQAIPSPFTVPVWLFAWLRNGANGVIQLAVFRLLRMNYLGIIHTEDNVELYANQKFAECDMNRIEKILFDHFCLPKSCNQNLPSDLYYATENHWAREARSTGFMLTLAQQRIYQCLVTTPAFILMAVLLGKIFLTYEKTDTSSLSWIIIFITSGYCWLIMLRKTLKKTNLERKGFSVKIITACTEHLKQALTCSTLLVDEEFVDYSIAANAVGNLPIKYREYYNIALTIQVPQSIEYTNS
ncbi:hypothetical protein [Klebsiella aerogenes]|uniref:hypothetical protein n=1 Tax=Klebsiella aerogenes TaxID=548 RepID=UPI0036CD20AC